MMAKFIRYCVLEEEHFGENVFRVHRPFPLGNPFTHIKNKETKALVKVKTREEAISLYEPYLNKMLEHDETIQKEWQKIKDAFDKFDEIYIGCYCRLNQSCHGDIIIKKMRQEIIKERLKEIIKK